MMQALFGKSVSKETGHTTDEKHAERLVCVDYHQALIACQKLGHLPVMLKPRRPRVGFAGATFKCTSYKELRDSFRIARRASSVAQVWVSHPS